VVAIIAILAAIAISQYQDYIIRSQVSEGTALADGMKSAIGEFINNHGTYSPSNASAGLALPDSIVGTYVNRVDASNGIIKVRYSSASPQKANPAISGMILQFSSVTHAGSVEWHCLSTVLKQKWCSSSCACSG
jgi:type IV pilus assembly protein PilA